MRSLSWSIRRTMVAIAILAVGMAGLLALRPRHVADDAGVAVLAVVLAVILTILTVAAELAMGPQGYRAFWLGFTITGWLCAVTALIYLQDTRRSLLRYGPPLAREREKYQRQFMLATIRGAPPPTRASEWYLLASLFAELGFGLALGAVASSAGGLVTAGMALIGRHAARGARRLGLVRGWREHSSVRGYEDVGKVNQGP
jgi:hypothetical protein